MYKQPVFFGLLVIAPCLVLAQPQFIASLYPRQHAFNVPADAALRVGGQAPLDPASLSDSSIYVWSDITGLHKLTVTLENGNKDLRIVPRHWRLNDRSPFNAGERVTVTLTTRLRYADGRPFEGFTWHYTVAVRKFRGGDFSPLAVLGGGGSTYFYVSDFNGDGWCDLIGNDDGVQLKMIVFLNDQTGRLLTPRLSNVTGSYGEVTDFDKDGDQDVFYGFQRAILNDGAGNLTQRSYLAWPNGQGKAYDFNNDGIIDYVIGYVLSDTLHFGLSLNGEPFKKLQKVLAPIRPPIFYIHGLSYDLSNDGRIDFLYVGGSGTGGFASFEASTGDSMRKLQALDVANGAGTFYGNDFDADNDVDYAFSGGGNQYITFLNDGQGQLKPVGLRQALYVQGVAGGDFDGDGDIDLAFGNSNLVSTFPERYAPDISIFCNDGKGNFSLSSRVRLPFDRLLDHLLLAVDLDRDGDLDLVGVAQGLFYVVANGAYPNAVGQRPLSPIPTKFFIDPIYPNPIRSEATIAVNLPEGSDEEVAITIIDINGRHIRNWLLFGRKRSIQLTWDMRDQKSNPVPSGVYFIKAQTGQLNAVQKLSIVK